MSIQPPLHPIRQWFRRNLSDTQVVVLSALLIAGFLLIAFLGRMLAPVLASLVLAYLLEGVIKVLERRRVPRLLAVGGVFFLSLSAVLLAMVTLVPLILKQIGQFVAALPDMISRGQEALLRLPEHYPELISEAFVQDVLTMAQSELTVRGQKLLEVSAASLSGLATFTVYLFIVPMLVFFFLKDKHRLLGWMGGFLPQDRGLAVRVWHEVDLQIGNYIRGKFTEILLVWVATWLTFTLLGLNFAMLLGLVTGLSVLIPYIGAAVVTLPVALVAYFQWGFGSEFVWAVFAYGLIQALDGNLLATLLFSEAVDLHPVAIIVAILLFGGLWGFWGIFFAIPLATLVRAVLNAWPRVRREDLEEVQGSQATGS